MAMKDLKLAYILIALLSAYSVYQLGADAGKDIMLIGLGGIIGNMNKD